MSEKKSPPHKDKASSSKPPQADNKTNKRKLATPSSPTEEDDKKNQQQQKRKRPNVPEGSSPEHMGLGSPRGAGTVSRLSVPLSERQQMALLMRMQDESSVGDASPKSPSSGNQVSSTKRTPADKKVNKRNERGEAPLHMAAKKGDYKQTKRLLKAGASVNMKDYAGWTALHEACNSGNLRVARYLLKAGADVNVQGFDDDTPLHDASSNGHRKLVQLLLRHGANPLQANLKGKTAINVAATSEIEAILRGNSASYSSDIDSNSEASSSDSNLSGKEDDRSNIDDDYKPQGTPGKPDMMSSSGPSSSVSSSLGPNLSSMGSVGALGIRRQSVPPSPEKMAASPRLFLKLQHIKPSSSSSSTADEQQRVSEWNVLTMDTGCEVTSEGDPASRSSFDRSASSTVRSSKQEDNWSRVISNSSGSRSNRGGAVDGDGCPDSTVTPTAPISIHPSPLERTATEPFTPRVLEHLGNSDNEEEHSDVFSSSSTNNSKTSNNTFNSPCSSLGTSNEIAKQQSLPPPLSSQQQQPQHLFQSLQQHQQQQYHPHQHHQQVQQQQQQHIPGQTISTYHGVRHNPSKVTNVAQTLPSSSFGSEQSGVSSSFPSSSSSSPSSSHRASGASCQFSFVSSSSSLPSSTSSSSSSVLGSGLSSHHQSHPPHHLQSGPVMSTPSSTSHLPDSKPGTLPPSLPFPPYTARGIKSGGSIVTGLSDRAMAASGAVNSISTISTSAPAPSQNPSWEAGRLPIPHLEDKSDTSSCDSSLRVDLEDSNPAPSEQGSRPTTPLKVPPLKIIMPTKVGGSSTNISKPSQAKAALPYVLNPTTESEGWDGVEEIGQRTLPSSSLTSTQEGADYSFSPLPRPSSRAGSGVGVSSSEMAVKLSDSLGTSAHNLDGEETASRESDTRAEHTDGSGEKSEDGREKRPTRTLRSHTAMMQQQQQKDKNSDKEKNGGPDTKEESDNCSTTRSQKGDDSAADDSSYPPRKRKLRNKTEQQTMQVPATSAHSTKISQPLEKPPNPYETYLNLRRQIALRHRSLCNIAPKPPNRFKDFLMVNCTYVLQGNATSTLSVPMLPPPNLVTEPMREFFIQQEKERYRLRLQHVIEREKLMLSIEQEILREHARAARAMANQTLPFSVCTILREEEIYNHQELEQVEDRDKNVRSRYNGRQFLSWLKDVDDKYEKIKQLLLLRHHHEAESLYAVQKLDWEWKLKECGLCDHKNTPVIDELHVPMVMVSDEFELLPSS